MDEICVEKRELTKNILLSPGFLTGGQPIEELISIAVQTAEIAFQQFEQRGWLLAE